MISFPKTKEEELKKVGAKLSLKDNMKVMQAWMDNGSTVLILLIGELNPTLGAQFVQLSPMDLEDDKIRDYGNHPQKMMGKMNATLHSTGWKAHAVINKIGGRRPSTIGWDLMPALGLKQIQATVEDKVTKIRKKPAKNKQGAPLDGWQGHYSKQFSNLISRVATK